MGFLAPPIAQSLCLDVQSFGPQRARAMPACLISAAMPAGGMVAGFVLRHLSTISNQRSALHIVFAALTQSRAMTRPALM